MTDLPALAAEIERRGRDGWRRAVIDGAVGPGEPGPGSCYWDGVRRGMSEAAGIVRAAAGEAPP